MQLEKRLRIKFPTAKLKIGRETLGRLMMAWDSRQFRRNRGEDAPSGHLLAFLKEELNFFC